MEETKENQNVIEAAALHQEAVEVARNAQLSASIQAGLQDFFQKGMSDKKFIDIGRIPFICEDIRGLHKGQTELVDTQKDIQNDLKWVKYIGGGFVAAAGLLALKSLGV